MYPRVHTAVVEIKMETDDTEVKLLTKRAELFLEEELLMKTEIRIE